MFNLFVHHSEDAWDGAPVAFARDRCLVEYTDDGLSEEYSNFDEDAIRVLKTFPCIFACETGRDVAPRYGRILDVTPRRADVRIEYEIQLIEPFLTAEQFERMGRELDLGRLETYRTHWALKDVDLPNELRRVGIELPHGAKPVRRGFNFLTHQFDVALSFPGEAREYVEQVAHRLESRLGPDRYFYDKNYPGQLARPNMDNLLQGVYRERSKLIVCFIGQDYQRKEWCGLEFRVVRDILRERRDERIMYVKLDDGPVEGILDIDGYLRASEHHPDDIAACIEERLEELR